MVQGLKGGRRESRDGRPHSRKPQESWKPFRFGTRDIVSLFHYGPRKAPRFFFCHVDHSFQRVSRRSRGFSYFICRGGAGGATPVSQIVTPPRMSTITVTASSGGVTPQTIQLALTGH
jgi:hypothetical protein